MISYRVEGRIVRVCSLGEWTPQEREQLYRQIANDSSVPGGAGLLVDVRLGVPFADGQDMHDALAAMQRLLGERLNSFSALVISLRHSRKAHHFQTLASAYGLRVGLFYSERMAVQWLSSRDADFGLDAVAPDETSVAA
jgi:hypothetical protein